MDNEYIKDLDKIIDFDEALHVRHNEVSSETGRYIDIDRMVLILTFLSTKDLVKHSETLNEYSARLLEQSGRLDKWTKYLIIFAFLQIVVIILVATGIIS